MLLSHESIAALANTITGFSGLTYEIKKSEVDEIFNQVGMVAEPYDVFFKDFPEISNNSQYSSNKFKLFNYVVKNIETINGNQRLYKLILFYFGQIYSYSDREEEVLDYINRSFSKDNCEVVYIKEIKKYQIYTLDGCLVSYDCIFNERKAGAFLLIEEHNNKCINKIISGDFTGAITNSRSLLEQIFIEIRKGLLLKINSSKRLPGYNGDIDALFGQVLDLLDIKKGLTGQPEAGYKKLEIGFKNLNSGISIIRHGMSDAHNISYLPKKKDALLAVNTAKTLANFLVEVYFDKYLEATNA
jgi:hypothetical protein